jgi:hypothetical protein
VFTTRDESLAVVGGRVVEDRRPRDARGRQLVEDGVHGPSSIGTSQMSL